MSNVSQAQVTRQTLEATANSIEAVFRRLYADRNDTLGLPPVSVAKALYFNYSGLATFTLRINTRRSAAEVLTKQADISAQLRRPNVRLYQTETGDIVVEVQIGPQLSCGMDAMLKKHQHRTGVIPIGINRSGGVEEFDFSDPLTSHVLISGMSGSGKSTLAHSMLYALKQTHSTDAARIAFIDYSGSSDYMKEVLGDAIVRDAYTVEAAVALLREIVIRMVRGFPYHLFVFIDELAGLCDQSTDALRYIETLTQQGRKFNVHVIACTQKPSSVAIGSLMKPNMARIVGKMTTKSDATVAAGIPGTGAEHLPSSGAFIKISSARSRFTSVLIPGYVELSTKRYYEDPFAVPELEAGLTDPRMTDAVNAPARQRGITLESVADAIRQARENGNLTKAAVFKLLGYQQAGGALRIVNQLWDEALVLADQELQ